MESELGPGDVNTMCCVVSSINPQKVDKAEGRLHGSFICLSINPIHSLRKNQKSLIVSAVQNTEVGQK